MWAEWCESCKQMDSTTFTNSNIIDTLYKQSWVSLKLDMTIMNDRTKKIQEKYKIKSLPTLILIPDPSNLDNKINLQGFVSCKNSSG